VVDVLAYDLKFVVNFCLRRVVFFHPVKKIEILPHLMKVSIESGNEILKSAGQNGKKVSAP